jgi:hypothetical protein
MQSSSPTRNNPSVDSCSSSGSSSNDKLSAKEQRHRFSPADRRILLTAFVFFASIINGCQSFSPVVDVRRLAKQTSTILYVVETERPTVSHPAMDPFPFTDFESIVASEASLESNDDDETQGAERNAQTTSEEDTAESYAEDAHYDEDEDEEKARRLARTSQAAALLARRTGTTREGKITSSETKSTSVGDRRVGSATKSRGGDRSMSRLAEALRKGASANTVGKNPMDLSSTTPKPINTNDESDTSSASAALRATKSVIHATVETMMKASGSIGLFGDPQQHGPNENSNSNMPAEEGETQHPSPGTVLVQSCRSTKPWKASDRVSVRVATTADDLDIANLRLSVFSDFSADMRRAFCARSCQVLSNRRMWGATCVVATVPRYGSMLSPRPDIILGTAECSFHEFQGTCLGQRRSKNSILYMTEVAVSPTGRRKGIGFKIMQVRKKFARKDLCHCVSNMHPVLN